MKLLCLIIFSSFSIFESCGLKPVALISSYLSLYCTSPQTSTSVRVHLVYTETVRIVSICIFVIVNLDIRGSTVKQVSSMSANKEKKNIASFYHVDDLMHKIQLYCVLTKYASRHDTFLEQASYFFFFDLMNSHDFICRD